METAIAAVSVPHLSELVTAIREIVEFVRGSHTGPSTRAGFISYLERVIALLEKDPRYIHADVVKAIEDLQPKLRRIVGKLSSQNSLLGRVRAMLISNEYLIEEARREIDDTLRMIQLNALSNGEDHVQPSTGGRMPQPIPASATPIALHTERGHGSTIINCACGFQDQTPLCPGTGINSVELDQGPESLLIAAYKDCLHHRHLVADDPSHLICLASSLDRLAKLLRKSGETAEATRYSQEAVEIYRRVVNASFDRANEPQGSLFNELHANEANHSKHVFISNSSPE